MDAKATTCTACDAGSYSSGRAVNCTVCPAGTSSGSRDSSCESCEAGTFADDEVGATACLKCSTEKGAGYWSSVGATECDQAAEGFFMNTQTGEPQECAEGMACTKAGITNQTITVKKRYFRFSIDSSAVYPCTCAANCRGSYNLSDSASRGSDRSRRRLGLVTGIRCADGSHGPLCSLCDTDHYLDASTGRCRSCEIEWVAPVLGLLAFAALCVTLGLLRTRLVRWAARNESWLPSFSEKVVLFIITMQIIFILKSNHTSVGGAEMAEPYASFVELTSFVDLDVPRLLPFNCLAEREWDHFDSLVSVTMTPIMLFASGSVLVHAKYRRRTASERDHAHDKFRYYFTQLMLLTVSLGAAARYLATLVARKPAPTSHRRNEHLHLTRSSTPSV